MSVEENKALVRRYIEDLDKGDMAIMEKYFATNCVYHSPGGVDLRGFEVLREQGIKHFNAFPDFQHTIEDMIAEGDKVVARFTDRGTHKGEYMGITPTGKQVMYTGIMIFQIADGKLVELWGEYDALGLMQQLGAVPPPGEGDNE